MEWSKGPQSYRGKLRADVRVNIQRAGGDTTRAAALEVSGRGANGVILAKVAPSTIHPEGGIGSDADDVVAQQIEPALDDGRGRHGDLHPAHRRGADADG